MRLASVGMLVIAIAGTIGCAQKDPTPYVRGIELKAGVVKTVPLAGMGHPRLVVSSDQDIDVGLVYATEAAPDLDKITAQGRVPTRYTGKDFKWSYTGIEKDMKLLLRSATDVTVTVRYSGPLTE
jgi:hypothetical protein